MAHRIYCDGCTVPLVSPHARANIQVQFGLEAVSNVPYDFCPSCLGLFKYATLPENWPVYRLEGT